jgi:hypothetical protein
MRCLDNSCARVMAPLMPVVSDNMKGEVHVRDKYSMWKGSRAEKIPKNRPKSLPDATPPGVGVGISKRCGRLRRIVTESGSTDRGTIKGVNRQFDNNVTFRRTEDIANLELADSDLLNDLTWDRLPISGVR